MAERKDTPPPAVGVRIELQHASKTLRGTVEQADDGLLLVRWDGGGFSTLRADRGWPHVIGHRGVEDTAE